MRHTNAKLIPLSLGLLLLGALLWWLLQARDPATAPDREPPSDTAPRAPQPRQSTFTNTSQTADHKQLLDTSPGKAKPPHETRPGCQAYAGQACHQGDQWWLDSCGQPHEKAEDCGVQLCQQGQCQKPAPDGCQGETSFGRCDGDTLHLCYAGRPMSLDCAAQSATCQIGDEGATCIPTKDIECDWPADEAVCEGDTLVTCHQGKIIRVDCALQNATCDALAEGGGFRCLQVLTTAAQNAIDRSQQLACGPCGCQDDQPSQATDEICDGIDNNLNGVIDEDIQCEPIPLQPILITDRRGRSSYATEDLQAELARVNLFHAGADPDNPGLRFLLLDPIALPRPDWLELDERDLNKAIQDPAFTTPGATWAIPIMFTDVVFNGGAPKLGLSTLPNGHCGGVRRSPLAQPPTGLIAVSKARSPTTLAHEIGHYLGLCHTHETRPGEVLRLRESGGGRLETCDECVLDGDGLCDTPPDPGPSACRYEVPACETICEGADQNPDPTNIMSYYTQCRRQFSPQQVHTMRQSAALRRAWHPCLLNPAACACDGPRDPCPAQMACKPTPSQDAWACKLEGGFNATQACQGYGSCQAESLCLRAQGSTQSHCARLCDPELSACDCVSPQGTSFHICAEDLQAR